MAWLLNPAPAELVSVEQGLLHYFAITEPQNLARHLASKILAEMGKHGVLHAQLVQRPPLHRGKLGGESDRSYPGGDVC